MLHEHHASHTRVGTTTSYRIRPSARRATVPGAEPRRPRQPGTVHVERLAASLISRPMTRYERWVKPVVDRLLAALLIIALSPLLACIALAVLLVIQRPILYTQTRMGKDAQLFPMLKFRTMLPDRRRHRVQWNGPERRTTHKCADDPRHTRLGRVMRKLSLDELPQLFNVVRGQMSLVGPRPELIELTFDYVEWQRCRHLVRPGITGLWQTTERGRGRLLHECIDLDLEYIHGLSFRRDLSILLRTPVALLRNRGVI